MSKVIEGQLSSAGLKFAIIVSRFNSFVTERLLAGALDALARTGADADDIEIVKVPGLLGSAAGRQELAGQRRHDAVICLSAVIRGDTPHFDYVAAEAAKGIAHASLETGVPMAFGVLTTNTLEQAIDRAGTKGGNKGFDAAMTAIEMANLMRRLRRIRLMPSRRRSRQRAVQVLYLWDMRRQPVEEAMEAYYGTLYSEESAQRPQRDVFMDELVSGAVARLETSTQQITGHAEHWRMERMPAVDRNILRLAVYEMLYGGTPAAGGDRRGAGTGAAVLERGVRAVRQRRAGRGSPRARLTSHVRQRKISGV